VDTTEAQALRAIPFFADLSAEDLEGVARVGHPRSFSPGEAIVEQGTPGDAMYVMLTGRAEVDVGGRFHVLKAGDFFGEMALITAKRRMATVRAVEPVEALEIGSEDFQGFLLAHAGVTLAILRAVIARLREVEERVDAWMGSG
jgi:CRP-like cAMP-binding protein